MKIKRKIRELKKLEKKIQTECVQNSEMEKSLDHYDLLWNTFFYLGEGEKVEAKYSMNQLIRMTKEELKAVIDEFLCQIFDYYYANIEQKDKDNIFKAVCDDDAMKKLRKLMKQYHPDNGGDSTMFIEVSEKYRRLKKELDRKYHADDIS